jgi:hypothetical protein
VETDVATLELETFTTALELDTDATPLELETGMAPLELETGTTPLELETEMDVCQDISKQDRYLANKEWLTLKLRLMGQHQ